MGFGINRTIRRSGFYLQLSQKKTTTKINFKLFVSSLVANSLWRIDKSNAFEFRTK